MDAIEEQHAARASVSERFSGWLLANRQQAGRHRTHACTASRSASIIRARMHDACTCCVPRPGHGRGRATARSQCAAAVLFGCNLLTVDEQLGQIWFIGEHAPY
jgi:hypothetical protein